MIIDEAQEEEEEEIKMRKRKKCGNFIVRMKCFRKKYTFKLPNSVTQYELCNI
jgi:hypothetical protein